MENENERITGRVRSREQADIGSDDSIQNLSRAELLQLLTKVREANAERDKTITEKGKIIAERDKIIAEKDKIIAEKEKLSILEDAVVNNWSYGCLMEKIDELRFELIEYSNDFKETNPMPSSVASTKTFGNGPQQVDMSQFKYQTLSYPERCSWKQVNLPDVLDSVICDTLFNKDRSVFEDTVAKFTTDLAGLRNVYGYYRQKKRKVTENGHFRPTFTLWLNALVHSISVLPEWGVNVRIRTIDKLEFSVHR